eukprot:7742598-Karenia_brevis.AAC.1
MLPSLEPESPTPKNAISGKAIEAAHISMVSRLKGIGEPKEPAIIQRHWVDVAKERWGERWGLIEPV